MKRYQMDLTANERSTMLPLLNRALGFSSPTDSRSVIERIRALVEDGEWPETVLKRLNGPAQKPPSSDLELMSAEPSASRATLAITRERSTTTSAPKLCPVKLQELICGECGSTWHRPSIRGRKPTKCETCR